MTSVKPWLEAFAAARRSGPFDDPWASTHGEGRHGVHVVFGSVVHGDEVGSLPAAVRLVQALASGELTFGGTVTVFLGNPAAALAGVRFLESDLNRVFLPEPPDTLEGRRARLIKPILESATLFLDLHQTIEPTTQPFWIFPFQPEGWYWARALGTAKVWVTRSPDQAFSAGSCCTDEYVRLRGRPGMTIELSQRGFCEEAEARAWQVMTGLLELADKVAAGASLREEALARPEIVFYETVHREPFTGDEQALRPGLRNFLAVAEGEELSAPGSARMLAAADGAILFPKYPPMEGGRYKRPLPGEIYRIVAPLKEHPTVVYGVGERP